MNRCAKFATFIFVAAVAFPCTAREPLTLESLDAQAVADAGTPEGKDYLKAFFTNAWRVALDAANGRCRAAKEQSGTHNKFVIAMSIGDNGYPADVLVRPDDEGMQCVANQLKATGFIRPPHDGFAIYMLFKATEPGTEHRLPSVASEEGSNQ